MYDIYIYIIYIYIYIISISEFGKLPELDERNIYRKPLFKMVNIYRFPLKLQLPWLIIHQVGRRWRHPLF